jgi:hypothetical protein
MYMPVHFVWNIETLQAYISIQYYARRGTERDALGINSAHHKPAGADVQVAILS